MYRAAVRGRVEGARRRVDAHSGQVRVCLCEHGFRGFQPVLNGRLSAGEPVAGRAGCKVGAVLHQRVPAAAEHVGRNPDACAALFAIKIGEQRHARIGKKDDCILLFCANLLNCTTTRQGMTMLRAIYA